MKKILLKTISLLMMALAPLAMPAVNTIIHTVTYDFSQMSTGTDTLGGVTYTTVNYAGLYNDGAPGTPSLPVDYLRFSVPWNATNFSVTTSVRNNVITNLKYLVYPCQPHWLMGDTTQHPVTLPDSSAYYSNSEYPSQRAWIVDEGFLAGENHIVTVAVMPVSFINSGTGPATIRQLIKSRTVTLTLHYDLSDSLAMYPIVRQDTVLRQEGYRLTQSLVVNPNNVAAYAPMDVVLDSLGSVVINPEPGGDGLNGGGLNPPDPGDISNDPTSWYGGELDMAGKCDYLIITTNDLYRPLRRLEALKRQQGMGVTTITLDHIYNHPIASQGDIIVGDNNEQIYDTTAVGKIRRYLKYGFITKNTQYVLLAGSSIPYRTERDIETDWYYYDLNSNVRTGSCDFYPDINIGRLIAKEPEQIDNYTDKVLRYEINPGRGDFSYLSNALGTKGIGLDIMNLYENTFLYKIKEIYPNESYFKEMQNQYYPTGRTLIDSINNNHYGFISILNHGSPYGIKVYGSDDLGRRSFIWAIDSVRNMVDTVSGNGLNNLYNRFYPMICNSISCETMPYSFNDKISFGESFTTGKDYGGPIYIGYTAEIPSHPCIETLIVFINSLKSGHYKVGEAYSLSKKGFSGAFLEYNPDNALAHNLLGDPSLEMWTDIPQLLTNIFVNRGDSAITISGLNTDSINIAICDNTKYSLLIRSKSSSVTFNKVSPNSTIMLYKHNYIPYIAPLMLQNVDLGCSQYVIASDVTAGRSVDSGRTNGDVTVKSGIEYEIEASGTVTLAGGFSVEKGATFAVYPSCF